MNSSACASVAAAVTSSSVASGPAEADVVHDRVAEQEGVLQHDADLPAQAGARHIAHVEAVDRTAPPRHIVEARDQVDDGGLAGAGRADDRDGLARLGRRS